MKIATTTGDFKRFCTSDTDRVREIADAGFKYIDLNMYRFTPECAYMQSSWRDEVEKLKEFADGLGVTFVQAHSQGGNPLSQNKDDTDFILAATERSIEICEILGIKNTVVHSGTRPDLCKDEWFELNKKFYEKLFPVMERCGVNVLCENSTKLNVGDLYFVNSGKDMREFIKYVDHPLFHGCWDTGHANCEGSQYDDIMALGDELFAIHYNDNHANGDEHIAPFLGTMNHDEVINALVDVGYKGYFTLECDSSLVSYNSWIRPRRRFSKALLSEPQLFMQRHIEKMMYETSEYILSAYGLLEK